MSINKSNSFVFSIGVLLLGSLSISPSILAKPPTLPEADKDLSQNSSALIPGVYYRRSYISIHQYGERICYTGGNINASTIASVEEDSEQSGIYRINGFDAEAKLFQVDANTLFFGGAEYERIQDVGSFEEIGSDVQTCLSSQEPYFSQEFFDN